MRVIKPPSQLPDRTDESDVLFLAGSIEGGSAIEWQYYVAVSLADTTWTILNPRRDNWDNSWVQSVDNPQFAEQVRWELSGLERADVILFYFDPNTKSPISLLELGLHAKSDKKLIVVCPEGFWRKGNVDIVCMCYQQGIKQVNSLDEAVMLLRKMINEK
jgi:hypothetical protein